MSFIALDICGGRFTKYYGIPGMVLHALSFDASYLPFSDNSAVKRWVPNGFHHATTFA